MNIKGEIETIYLKTSTLPDSRKAAWNRIAFIALIRNQPCRAISQTSSLQYYETIDF